MVSKTSVRLVLSLGLSLACAWGTDVWYRSGLSQVNHADDEAPLARLTEHVNEVQRKPLTRLIWQNLSLQENLYSGEQIRTTDDATAVVEFMDGTTVVKIEPGSLITLERSNGKLVLDFISGGLFVQRGAENGDLAVKSGGEPVMLEGDEVSLEKAGKAVEVRVHKSNRGEAKPGLRIGELGVLQPAHYSEVYLSPENEERVVWRLAEKITAASQLELEVGPTKSRLKRLTSIKIDNDSTLSAVLKPGQYFWRLTERSQSDPTQIKRSFVHRLKVTAKRPPLPLEPRREAKLPFHANGKIRLAWANPARLGNMVIELAENENLRQSRQIFQAGNRNNLDITIEKPGNYFWRITGYTRDKSEPLSSSVHRFELLSDFPAKPAALAQKQSDRGPGSEQEVVSQTPLLPPTTPTPEERKSLSAPVITHHEGASLQASRNGSFNLKWEVVPGASAYEIQVIDEKGIQIRSEKVQSNQKELRGLQPGQLSVRIFAIDAKGDRSPTFASRAMIVPQTSDAKAPSLKKIELE